MSEFVNDGTFIPDAPPKDPDSTIDYGVNWSDWLKAGETISSSSWPETGDLVEVSSSNSDTATAVVLSGGVVGNEYTVTNRITTTGDSVSRTEDRSMKIKCQEK